MTPDELRSLKEMVRNKTDLGHVQSSNVVRLMVIKNQIDKGHHSAALHGLLEFVMRSSDLGPSKWCLDDLTKLLNTGSKDFDTARILIDGLYEDEV